MKFVAKRNIDGSVDLTSFQSDGVFSSISPFMDVNDPMMKEIEELSPTEPAYAITESVGLINSLIVLRANLNQD